MHREVPRQTCRRWLRGARCRLTHWVGGEILNEAFGPRERADVRAPRGVYIAFSVTFVRHVFVSTVPPIMSTFLPRIQAIQRIIDIAHHCVGLRNYNAVFAIVTCLSAHYIRCALVVRAPPGLLITLRPHARARARRRLDTAWEHVSRPHREALTALETLMSPASSYIAYRKVRARCGAAAAV